MPGCLCLLLDIVPPDLTPDAPAERNKIVRARPRRRQKIRPPPFSPPPLPKKSPSEILKMTSRAAPMPTGSSKSSPKISRSSASCSLACRAIPQARRHRHHQHLRLARPPDRRRPARRISAALGRHPFLQPAALPESWSKLIPGPKTSAEVLDTLERILRPPPRQRRGHRQRHAEFHRQPHRHFFHAQCAAPDEHSST